MGSSYLLRSEIEQIATASDDTSPVYPIGSKHLVAAPRIAASFPFGHDDRWFDELRHLRGRDVGGALIEVKWAWFKEQLDRGAIPAAVRAKVFTGLSVATIHVADLNIIYEPLDEVIRSLPVSQIETARNRAIEKVASEFLRRSALSDFRHYAALASSDDEYQPLDFEGMVQMLKTKRGNAYKSAMQLGLFANQAFQELRDPEFTQTINEQRMLQRYVSNDKWAKKVLLHALKPQRLFDRDNDKAQEVLRELRETEIGRVRDVHIALGGVPEELVIGELRLGLDSSQFRELQMADLAAGYAARLFMDAGGSVKGICDGFAKVFLNGDLVARN